MRPHSISKKDHRAQYRPSRTPRHLASEGYLRPDQAAKAVFFEFIDDCRVWCPDANRVSRHRHLSFNRRP